jgi:NAD(P)-dependent dehydrogenase (short-subunit alcohol dehydrogenase family)
MANVFITGASTGIGEATALHLDGLGHRVFAGVRNDADGDRLVARASKYLFPVRCDVTDLDQIAAARKVVGEEAGEAGLQGLVNNAGVAVGGPLEHLPLERWRWQFDVNVFGQIAVTQAFLDLVRQGRGRVSFTGSIGGRNANAMLGPYAASKHAIEAISQSLRGELEPWSIHVSVVEPGAIKTPIWDKGRNTADMLAEQLGPEAAAQYAEGIDFVRKGIEFQDKNAASPEKVAKAFEHALFSRRPHTQYLVGIDAKVLGTLNRLLPQSVLDRIVKRLGPS